MNFLEDDIIRLRPVEPEDIEFIQDVESDSTQWVENSMLAPFSKENIVQYVLSYNADPFSAGQLRLIIETRSSPGSRIGIIDLYDISVQHRRGMIGIYIIKEERNRSYAKRALALLDQYAYKVLNLRMLGAYVADTNEISNLLFQSNGYRLYGQLPDWIISGNEAIGINIFTKKLI